MAVATSRFIERRSSRVTVYILASMRRSNYMEGDTASTTWKIPPTQTADMQLEFASEERYTFTSDLGFPDDKEAEWRF